MSDRTCKTCGGYLGPYSVDECMPCEARRSFAAPTGLADQREKVWGVVLHMLNNTRDANLRAIIVQSAIADIGPVPNSMGETIRKAMVG